jgi:hypothetical protein
MRRLALLFPLLVALPAAAQNAPAPAPVQQPAPGAADDVTVTGAREQAIAKFVETRAAATRFAGKIARWQARICPKVYGIPDNYAKFIVAKLNEVAKEAGAKTNVDPACRVNIQIVFTTSPQALMDNIRKEHPNRLGYHDSLAQAEQMTQLKRPVHAFYTTQTTDYRGQTQIDTKRRNGITLDMPTPPPQGQLAEGNSTIRMDLSNASGAGSVSGTRFLGDGIQAEFNHIVIVVDTTKVTDLEMGTLGDYIAMLALSQPERFDACQDLASITNLMITPACASANTVNQMSPHDISYLQGLYNMNIAGSLRVQKSQITSKMKQVQEGQ